MLHIENAGTDIVSTNFWDTEFNKRGKFFLSVNAGAFRLLVPESKEAEIEEMKTGKIVIISQGFWKEAGSVVDALVNTVNIVGVMGKGIALQFKHKFLQNYAEYRKACFNNEIKIGKMFVFCTNLEKPRYIINFPTKRHWKDKSRIEDIKIGLETLVDVVRKLEIRSIAIPPLGSYMKCLVQILIYRPNNKKEGRKWN